MREKRILRSIGFCFCFFLLSIVPLTKASAQVKPLYDIGVSYGFENILRFGRVNPITVTVSNSSQETAGSVQLMLINDRQDNVCYQKNIHYTKDQDTQISFAVPINQTTVALKVTLLNEHKKVILEKQISVKAMNFGESYYVGLLSNSPEQLAYFTYFGNKCVSLQEGNLQNDYRQYDALDIIVVDNYCLDQLDAGYMRALILWMENGGNLVLGTDESTLSNIELLKQYGIVSLKESIEYQQGVTVPYILDQETSTITLKNIIKNYEAGRKDLIAFIKDSISNGVNHNGASNYELSADNIYVGKSMIDIESISKLKSDQVQKTVQLFTLQNTYMQQMISETCVYDYQIYRNGTLQVFHYPLGNEKLTTSNLELNDGATGTLLSLSYAQVVQTVMSHVSDMINAKEQREAFGHQNFYDITLGEWETSEKAPALSFYIIMLVCYAICVGPILFLVLRHRNHSMRLWVYLPILSIGFFIALYMVGSATRVSEPYMTYLDVAYYDSQSSTLQGNTYASLVLPSKDKSSIVFGESDIISLQEDGYPDQFVLHEIHPEETSFYDYDHPDIYVEQTKELTKITYHKATPFEKQPITVGYSRKSEQPVKAKLRIDDKGITGMIQNQDLYSFTDSFLYFNGVYYDIGPLANNQSITTESCGHDFLNSYSSPYFENSAICRRLSNNQEISAKELAQKNSTLFLLKEKYLSNCDQVYFVGYINKEQSVSPLYSFMGQQESMGGNVVVVPIDADMTEKKITFVPNMDRYAIKDKNVIWEKNSRYVYASELEIQYYIPNSVFLRSILFSQMFQLDMEQQQYAENNCARIYFYNWETKTYDLIFNLESDYKIDEISEIQMRRYLRSDGLLKMKYEGSTSNAGAFILPVLSCYRRE